MVLVLVVGDLHVPERASGIPEVFRKMFTPGRIETVFITGNVGCQDMYRYFQTIASEVYCTAGEYDSCWTDRLPDSVVVDIENLKIGLVHGHAVIPAGDRDSLAMVQRQLGVDILLSGATHVTRISEFDNHLFVNPGSLTGAMAPTELSAVPSFVLLDIREKSVSAFTYRYLPRDPSTKGRAGAVDAAGDEDGKATHEPSDDADVKIKKKEWTKE